MSLLKYGSKGAEVYGLQKALIRLGFTDAQGKPLIADADFGLTTEYAVMQYQKKAGLVADGKVGDKTLQALAGKDTSKCLKDSDYQAAAKRLNVPELYIRVFGAVESNGQGFLDNAKPKILFERHRMYAYLKQKMGEGKANQCMAAQPNIVNTVAGGYQGGIAEYYRLALAQQIDLECAYQSTSWGQFQIMGENWQALGYKTVQDFVNEQFNSESAQLESFIRFVEWKTGTVNNQKVKLIDALREGNWDIVFTLYNGANYKKLGYQAKFQKEWDHLEPLYGVKPAA
ncbi:N-acetylmuramidase domain-containing protein [Acinetobacter rathckeae]|uniref:N-acetylmuramidase domain-containing protein n=1 Tax=Acinetobacter rathckeae TaxID=2605272 RepID=UPI0018A24E51|nr:N-acetylmuramidase family protein [Acinetobacter rathckeae]MBF7687746.1 N-acetylmuramidase family protein [Acinetobacter rathckeae]MBF7688031.1 N-acetylmuramidase family protein [Acinetobacter rathckeae]